MTLTFPRLVALVATLLGLLAAAPVGAQESRPSEPVELRLDLQLVDRTGMLEASPQHGTGEAVASMEDHVLANATVELTSFTPEAEEVVTTGRTDAVGRIVLELGQRIPGSPYELRAIADDGTTYHAKPANLAPAGGQLLLYRGGRDRAAIRQVVMRIVTVSPGGDDPASDTVLLQVRQIVNFQNGGFEAYEGPEGADGAGFVWTVPRDAVVSELRFGSEPALDIEPRDVPGWGYGVPIPQPLFPLESGFAVGVYTQEVERGGLIDFGITPAVDTNGLQLALEQGVLFHDAAAVAEMDGTQLSGGEAQMMPDVGRTMEIYTSGPVRAGGTIVVPARYGPPGVAAQTIFFILLIVACFAIPIVGGLAIARRSRESSGTDARRAEIERLYSTGELSEIDYRREVSRLGWTAGENPPAPAIVPAAAPAPSAGTEGAIASPVSTPAPVAPPAPHSLAPEILERLEVIAGRNDAENDQVARDVRELARIVRDQLREGTR